MSHHSRPASPPSWRASVDSAVKRYSSGLAVLYALGMLGLPAVLSAQPLQTVQGHVPQAVSGMTPVKVLPDSTPIDLIIGLPVRNSDQAQVLLQDLYDPVSPRFHHYLSPQDYVDSYAPTTDSYAALLRFAQANDLAVVSAPPNRKFVHVLASAATVDKVFHVTLREYRHPSENRLFYATDVEPSVDLQTPISFISGLDNFHQPGRFTNHYVQTKNDPRAAAESPAGGSGSGGLYAGGDFRAAYAPGVSLTGQGQSVGIIELNGYNASDINTYETTYGIPNTPITNVYLDGYTGGSPNSESAADIELVKSMAPGASPTVYGAPYSNAGIHDVLNELANPTKGEVLPYQITTSYYFFYDQNVYDSLTQLALQGQALFVASGDFGAYNESTGSGDFPPADFPYVTSVGGTELKTSGPRGRFVSESAAYFSGGGYSPWAGGDPHFALPSWQFGMNLSLAHGSNFARNAPDVAMVADNISIYFNGQWQGFAGTSAAAPLWAGFMALANQQAAELGVQRVGFANPALYSVARSGGCSSCFHDITVGNNFNEANPGEYAAVKGYDLVTGWGTPGGSSLINALVSYGSVSTGSIWRYTGTPCGSSCPGWVMLDDNSATVGIAASGGNLYQVHQRNATGGEAANIWQFTNEVCTGAACPGWIELDDNPATVAVAADGNNLYQLHNTGKIWKSTGVPCNSSWCPGWEMLDDNPAAVAIAASGGNLYQLHSDGSIWKWLGGVCNGSACYSWEMLDNNRAAKAIVADGNNLYELHDNGRFWKWTGAPCVGNGCYGWQQMDDNAATISIAAAGGNLYELRDDGTILKSTGAVCVGDSCTGWETIGNTAQTVAIVADANNLYRLRNTGIVESWNGTPHSWTELDKNPLTTQIAAGGGNVYQLHERH